MPWGWGSSGGSSGKTAVPQVAGVSRRPLADLEQEEAQLRQQLETRAADALTTCATQQSR
jgi:hypothetical protein